MLKVMEKKNDDKGELIDRTAWFTSYLRGRSSLRPIGEACLAWFIEVQ